MLTLAEEFINECKCVILVHSRCKTVLFVNNIKATPKIAVFSTIYTVYFQDNVRGSSEKL